MLYQGKTLKSIKSLEFLKPDIPISMSELNLYEVIL